MSLLRSLCRTGHPSPPRIRLRGATVTSLTGRRLHPGRTLPHCMSPLHAPRDNTRSR
jgi:hypothetical protein